MKRTYIAICAAAIALASCDSTPKFSVEGTISNAKDSTLYLVAITKDKFVPVDSVKLDEKGDFRFKADAPSSPDFYSLIMNNHRIDLAIDSTEAVKISADSKTMDTDYTVEGSACSERIRDMIIKRNELEKKLIAIEENSSLYPKEITDSITALVNEHKDWLVNSYIREHHSTLSGYYALMQGVTDISGTYSLFNPYKDRNDAKCYATIATSWQLNHPNSPRTHKLCDVANKAMQHTAPVQEKVLELDSEKISETGIINISLPDASGKTQNIKDLKGKVVLLDFTMYSASESAERTIKMRELHDKYRSQGFEIYQISLDDNLSFWKNAVDKLEWICVHETNGQVTASYGVQKLPTFFLINRANEVVVRSDFMEGSLEDNIKKLL